MKYRIGRPWKQGSPEPTNHNPRVNYTNIITYESLGQTLYTGNDEMECSGVDWWSNTKSKKMENIVEWRSDHLELSEFEEILIDDESWVTVAGRHYGCPSIAKPRRENVSCVREPGSGQRRKE